MAGKLHLRVVTPTRVVVETEVDEVSLPGILGQLGILPGHAALLTSLRIGELGYVQGAREHFLALQWGFAEIADDTVTVLADVAELPAEIDVEAARADKLAAEDALRSAAAKAFEANKARLEAAVTRIAVATRR
ncbi:MAG: F0F1 ATP synthase subunit epsilon [Acidobacteriota bacterium]